VIYASTKVDDTIRYHSLHDNRYLMYFRGHKTRVTTLEMSPINDTFLSGSVNDCVRLWDLRSPHAQGIMPIKGSPLVAYDPQGIIFAIALNSSSIRLYDSNDYERGIAVLYI
jgi:COMPASS component SWD2